MEIARAFIDENISNPPNPNNVDQIFEISNQFSQMLSNLSDQEKKELGNYLRGLYNKYLEKVKNCNCIDSQGGKKSRRRKHKKRNTLTRGVKRGGDPVFDYIGTIAIIVALLVVGTLLTTPSTARDEEGWAYER